MNAAYADSIAGPQNGRYVVRVMDVFQHHGQVILALNKYSSEFAEPSICKGVDWPIQLP